ncbi:MAG: hypothetical protein FJZ63_03405 [Chlamydiae bacterium]|nr:hypothetical protein [Chlamydiota bacterium]
MSSSETIPPPGLLVITTSGGGGHLQAANAKILEEQARTCPPSIFVYDLLQHAGGKWLGWFMIHFIWNKAQRKGSVKGLELWLSLVPLFDILFWLPVFCQILWRLFRYDITQVVDTQPLCLSAILHAIRVYSFFKKRNLLLEKVLTELPTSYATYFLKPIKRLSEKSRSLVRLYSTTPLLKEGESPQAFWDAFTGLPLQHISYEGLPIRPTFKNYHAKKLSQESLTLHIQQATAHEKSVLQKILDITKKPLPLHFDSLILNITLMPQDVVTTLMLGSQTVQEATLHYVEEFIKLMQHLENPTSHYYLFVFCSPTTSPSLQEKVCDHILQTKDFPPHLTIIPMSPQKESVVAPLYFRSHMTITKSGGITAMELLAVAQGKILIHHDEQKSSLEKLLSYTPLSKSLSENGMPKWEYGNATYLEKHKNAKLVTPSKLLSTIKPYFCL